MNTAERNFEKRNKENATDVASEVTVNNSGKSEKVICDTIQLKEKITKWMQNEGWRFEDFVTFVELIGIKTPIRLSELSEENNSFKCITAHKEIIMSIQFGDFSEIFSELWITYGEETKKYAINTNMKKGKTVPEIRFQGRIIKRNGKELYSFYYEFFCHRLLKLDENHIVEIMFYEPSKSKKKNEIFVLRNCAKIEEYLLGVDDFLNMEKVYNKLIEFLDFSEENILNSEKILLAYYEKNKDEKAKKIKSKILIEKGIRQEYAITEDRETFHICKDGSWYYLYDNDIQIVYYGENDDCNVFSITGAENQIMLAPSPNEILTRAKKKISEMRKFVR